MTIYVDPNDVKGKLDYPLFYKESFLLFAVMVAGKSSETIKKKTNELIADLIGKDKPESLFSYIIENYGKNDFEKLLEMLKKHKTGKYSLLLNFFRDLKSTKMDLMNCSLKELESLRGVGKKSSRFFMVYNRADIEDCAILDTHILKFLRANGYEAPEQTPSKPKLYEELESAFLELASKVKPKMTIPDLDFLLWYSAKTEKKTASVSDKGELIFFQE